MKKSEVLMLISLFFILAVAWIAFSVYHHSVASKIPAAVEVQILEISPTFNTKTIDTLKKRSNVEPLYDLGAQPVISPPPATPSPATSSAKVATQGGILR